MTSCDEILQRILSLPKHNSWSVLIVPAEQQQLTIEELEETIPVFLEESIHVISANTNVATLLESIYSSDEFVFLWNFESWTAKDWKQLDYDRSQFSHDNGGLFLLTPETAASFQTQAPNFASWVGGKVYALTLGTEILTEADRQQRLEILQTWLGKTNHEVIRLAEIGELPSDPSYGEWLILLDRGDLVGR
jgi:hypothetical protein